MRIVGYMQAKNELRNGNLERALTNLSTILGEDNFVVYDDGSDDGSQDEYKKYTSHIIYGSGGEFIKELFIKQKLLDYSRSTLKGDWVLWSDADCVFDKAATDGGAIIEAAERGDRTGVMGWGAFWLNAYLHPRWHRVDSQFSGFGQIQLYKLEAGLSMNIRPGLHQRQTPNISNARDQSEFKIIHLGFASPQAIEQKYRMYSQYQRGWALERIINMDGMQLDHIPLKEFPSHYQPENVSKPLPINFDWLRKTYFGLDEA